MVAMEEESQGHFFNAVKKRSGEQAKRHGYDLEYLEEALKLLQTFTRTQLSGEEKEAYLIRLATYPKDRLLRLIDFTGHIAQVWKFLDELRPEAPMSTREDIGYLDAPREDHKGIAEECRAYIGRLMDEKTTAERDKIELDFVTTMRKKYSRLSWMCGRKANLGR